MNRPAGVPSTVVAAYLNTVYINSMKHRRSIDLSASGAVPPQIHRSVTCAPVAALKGRGTAWSIAPRFSPTNAEPFDDGWGDATQLAAEQMVGPRTEIIEQRVGSILSPNDSPDISFDLSINPYRGCEHGCIYCFARPTHSYLDLSPGIDFETKIVAKLNAADRLREAIGKPGYKPQLLNVGSVTDAYQPVERRLRHHAGDHRGAAGVQASVFARHQVGRRGARPGPARADGAKQMRWRSTSR